MIWIKPHGKRPSVPVILNMISWRSCSLPIVDAATVWTSFQASTPAGASLQSYQGSQPQINAALIVEITHVKAIPLKQTSGDCHALIDLII